MMHPSQALFQDQTPPVLLPVCDHYAGSEKLMKKSMELQHKLGPVFDITFDCEDGAASGNEAAHANLVAELLNSAQNRFNRIGVRVHHPSHPAFEQDLAIILATAADRLAYLVLPKIQQAAQVMHAIAAIRRHQPADCQRKIPVHVLIETHEALADAMAIAAIDQVECLSFGIMDFVSAHYGAIPGSAMRSPEQFSHPLVCRAKLEIAAACHRYGKVASHNVTTDISSPYPAASDARQAGQQFGYTRMWSIHPQQIQAIIDNLAPRHQEVADAAAILLAAQASQWGPIQYHGHLHDRASYRYYWTILKRAQLSAIPLSEAASALL